MIKIWKMSNGTWVAETRDRPEQGLGLTPEKALKQLLDRQKKNYIRKKSVKLVKEDLCRAL